MRLVGKSGSEILIMARPEEEVVRGDYLVIEDSSTDKRMIIQAYDETYVDAPGILEDMVREEVVHASAPGVNHDPLEVRSIAYLIRDLRLLKCKIRASVDGVKLSSNVSWLPSRTHSKVARLRVGELMALAAGGGRLRIDVGTTSGEEGFALCAESLDGQLNIITGKKESGKSHLAKLLVSKLAEFGAYVLVFDLNDEYGGIAWTSRGEPGPLAGRVVRLEPGVSLKFSLQYLGYGATLGLLLHVLDIPGASLREFTRIWELLSSQGVLSLRAMGEAIQSRRCNELVRDALLSRYHSLVSSRLFTDREEEVTRLEELVRALPHGGVLIVSLCRVPAPVRRMAVELVLSKLVSLLEHDVVPPFFLFAEEAHLYLRETYWDDLVTRMRHFGVFSTFITNQPDAVKDNIYRQADNIFLFNFTNELDLEMISRASATDADTIKSIVRTLPPRHCLALGRMVHDLPVVIKVAPSELMTRGETKLFFDEAKVSCRLSRRRGEGGS